MKQTRTTLKELTAAYRAVLRHGVLCNAIALGLIAAPAMAEYTNVSLDELYPTGTASSFKYDGNQNVSWLAENISVTEPGDGRAIEIGKNGAFTATEPTVLHLGGNDTNSITINTAGDGILVRTKSLVDVHANDTISITSTVGDLAYDGGVGYGALWVQNSTDPGKTDTYATVNLTANQINLTNLNASAIAAISEGRVNINGNATIRGKDAIYASGFSETNINATGDKTVKMEGDIDFRQGPASGTPIDATVNVTLNGAESYWTGNTALSYVNRPSDDKLQINHGATITMKDGATWTATEVAESAEPDVATDGRYYTALKNLNVDNGNVVINRANGITVENLITSGLNITGGTMSVSKSLTATSEHTTVGAGAGLNIDATEGATFTGMSSSTNNGGAVENAGTVVATGVAFTDNNATYGGAVYNTNTMDLGDDLTMIGNSAISGGAIYNAASGDITIGDNALFKENTAEYNGGQNPYGGSDIKNYGNITIGDNATFTRSEYQDPIVDDKYDVGVFTMNGSSLHIGDNASFSNIGQALNNEGNTIHTIGDGATFEHNGSVITNFGGTYTIGDNATFKDSQFSTLVNKSNNGSITIGKNALFEGNQNPVFHLPTQDWVYMDGNGAVANNDKANDVMTFGDGLVVKDNTASGNGIMYNNVASAVLNFGSAEFTGNTAEGGVIYNKGVVNLAGSTSFSGNKNAAEEKINDIYNTGTLNLTATADKIIDITLDGGIDGTGTVNVNGAGTVNLAGDVLNQTVHVTNGELHLTDGAANGSNISGSTVDVASGATLNSIDSVANNYANITLADGANISLDADFNANGAYDQYSINDGATVNVTGLNLLNALNSASIGERSLQIASNNLGNVNLAESVAKSVKAYTSEAAYGIQGNDVNNGTISLVQTGASTGFDMAVNNTETANKSEVIYDITAGAGETFTNGDKTIKNADFVVHGNNKDITAAAGVASIIVNEDSTLTMDNATIKSFEGAAIDNAGEATLSNVTFAANNAKAIKNTGLMRVFNSNVFSDVDTSGVFVSDPSTYSGTVTNTGVASFDEDTFTGTAVLANSGKVDLKNGVTFESGAAITGDGVLNLISGTTVFNDTASSNTINVASGADWSGVLASTGVLNTQNGAIDAITGGSVTGGDLYVDANLVSGEIDSFGGTTGANVKGIKLTNAGYGTENTVSLALGDATLDSDLDIEGTNYYTSVTKDGNNIVFSDKLINESNLDAKLGSWSGGNYIKTNSDMTHAANGTTYLNVGQALSALDTAIGDMSGFGSANHYATNITNVATNLGLLDSAIYAINTSDVMTSGINATKVATYDGYATTIAGKQDTIDSTHKLAANLIETSDSLQFVSASDKTTWSNKQNAISDSATIVADGASLKVKDASIGATQLDSAINASLVLANSALQADSTLNGAKLADGTVAKEALSSAVQASLGKADTALQSGDSISALNNDAGYQTATQVSEAIAGATIAQSQVTGLGDALNAKQDAIDSSHKLAANLVAFSDAQQNAIDSGITAAKVATYDGYATTIASNTEAIALLNGDENTSGSVAYAVKQLADGAVATNTANIATNTDAIALLNDAEDVTNSVRNIAKSYATTAASGANDYTDTKVAALANGAVKDNTDAIALLNGDETTTGSVAKSVKDAVDAEVTARNNAIATATTMTADGANYANNDSVLTAISKIDTSIGTTIDGNYVAATNNVGTNLGLLDTQVKANADAVDLSTVSGTYVSSSNSIAANLNQLSAAIDASATGTLAAANTYTDQRVESMDKNLSAGVAGAVALSSVAVSGVERGEVSVGAGYGYFNGQSAAAFGAAMGLSNRWSINAGAGLSNADVSFRAGTNYKFKLF